MWQHKPLRSAWPCYPVYRVLWSEKLKLYLFSKITLEILRHMKVLRSRQILMGGWKPIGLVSWVSEHLAIQLQSSILNPQVWFYSSPCAFKLHWPASHLEPGSYLSVSDSKQFVCFLAVFKVFCALESPGDVPGLGPAGTLVYGFWFMVWTGADSLFGSFVLQYWGLSLGHCTSYATTPLS